MATPTPDEISPFGTLDEIDALEHFGGKTLLEAEVLFRENGQFYAEDLMWMGSKAFCYYLPAARKYLESDASSGDYEFVSGLCTACGFRFDEEFESVSAAIPEMRAIATVVLRKWREYDIDDDIYDEDKDWYTKIAQRLEGSTE